MNALLVLYAAHLSAEADESLIGEKSAFALALEQSQRFPGVNKTVVLTDNDLPAFPGIQIERRKTWTVKSVLEAIAVHSEGFELSYFCWADCPFLDPELAGKLAGRQLRYAAEYAYADGWPYGLAPELLSPGTAAILAKILGDDDGGPVRRDALFSVIQKDINAFDIETEISTVDFRRHRLNLCADSRRNLLLLRRFATAGTDNGGIPGTAMVENIITEKPEILRTLPAFYPIQVYGGCPQSCAWCLWPALAGGPVTERRDYMAANIFEKLLEKISSFSGDAVIDLSLWGELSLHPQKMDLIAAVLRRPNLALVIETSGIGWQESELERCAELARSSTASTAELRSPPPLSWIVSLDTADPERYREIRGAGFTEAQNCARKLLALFPQSAYVQAVRTAGAEDDIERFYRSWKEAAPSTANIIIQKYDDFCGTLPRRQASDLSPVLRQPCWHLMRDMPILIDGTVLLCREQPAMTLGNALDDSLELIWERGQQYYDEKEHSSLCAGCDEYYTYNF